jgi:hypothetical protein
MRSASLTAPASTARRMLAFVRAQRAPYLPVQASLAPAGGGLLTLTIRFAAPAPLGLLQTQASAAPRRSR